MNRIRLAPLLFILFMPLIGWTIDLQPNDIVAPPPGKNLITISYFNTENSTLYANGSVNSKGLYTNPVIDTQSAILRGTRTYSLGNLPAASFIQIPYGTVRPAGSLSGLSSDMGIGDLTIATVI